MPPDDLKPNRKWLTSHLEDVNELRNYEMGFNACKKKVKNHLATEYVPRTDLQEAIKKALVCSRCEGKKTIHNIDFEVCTNSKDGIYYNFKDCNEAMKLADDHQQISCFICKEGEVVTCHWCLGSGTEDSTSHFLKALNEIIKKLENLKEV